MWLSLMWQPLWRTTRRPCCQRTEDCGPETRSSRCAVKDFYQCSEYNCDFSVNKTEDKLSTFKNGFRLLSMQHWTSAEPAISSASQDNPGISWNQKIHHRVQNSLSSAKLITVKNSDTISGRSISILLFHLRLGLSGGLLHSGFPNKTLYAFLFSYVPHTFPLSSSFIS